MPPGHELQTAAGRHRDLPLNGFRSSRGAERLEAPAAYPLLDASRAAASPQRATYDPLRDQHASEDCGQRSTLTPRRETALRVAWRLHATAAAAALSRHPPLDGGYTTSARSREPSRSRMRARRAHARPQLGRGIDTTPTDATYDCLEQPLGHEPGRAPDFIRPHRGDRLRPQIGRQQFNGARRQRRRATGAESQSHLLIRDQRRVSATSQTLQLSALGRSRLSRHAWPDPIAILVEGVRNVGPNGRRPWVVGVLRATRATAP